MKIRDQRNYLIIALCAILIVMGIGYAAFSQLLTINGTATVSNSWCVGFDNTKTNTYQITKGVSTGTSPTGSMTYSGTACSSTLQPTSTLSSVFYQPGDQIEYTLTIQNASTVPVAIKSILIDNQSVTSNTTITKGNIQYIVEMPTSTNIAVSSSTTMKVTAKFQNDTDVTGPYAGSETQTVEVKINAEQGDGTDGFNPAHEPYSGDVYAWNTSSVTIGTSTINDLASTKTAQPYYSSAADVMSASGYTFFNKYTVVNDAITEGYACHTFGISEFEPVCLKMSTDGSSYGDNTTGNKGILKALSTNEIFIGNNPAGSCDLDSGDSYCSAGSSHVYATSDGYVDASDDSTDASCYVGDNGDAKCGDVRF